MKIAILLTGNLRSWRICGQVLKKSLIDHYDCDIFMSVDMNNSLQCENQNYTSNTTSDELVQAVDFYKPVKVFHGDYEWNSEVQVHKIKVYNSGSINVNWIDDICVYSNLYDSATQYKYITMDLTDSFKILYKQYYYVNECHKLMKEYAKKLDVKYDCVIRVRFDQLIWDSTTWGIMLPFQKNLQNKIIYNDHNIQIANQLEKSLKIQIPQQLKDTVHVFGAGKTSGGYMYVNDQFWMTDLETSDILADFYNHLTKIITKSAETYWPNHHAMIEHFFAIYLHDNSLRIKCSPIKGVFIRTKA